MPPSRKTHALRKALAAQRSRRDEEPSRRRPRQPRQPHWSRGPRGPRGPEPPASSTPPEPMALGPEPQGQAADDWLDVSAPLTDGRPLGYAKAFDWELVLAARDVTHRMERTGGGWRILAPAAEAGRAVAELSAYRAENRPARLAMVLPRHENRTSTTLALSLLLAFFALTHTNLPDLGLYAHTWNELGSAKAGRILDGEWWRLVTALTLHADAAHVLGNVVVGVLFIVPICAMLGSGPGWLAVLLSGLVGNFVNALVQGPRHDSIGFSTCVFGAAGILAGLRAMTGTGRSPVLTSVAAGLALLALLGVGGERTDVGAHLFGFLSGLGLGLAVGWHLLRAGPFARGVNVVMALAAMLIPCLAWGRAFFSS